MLGNIAQLVESSPKVSNGPCPGSWIRW